MTAVAYGFRLRGVDAPGLMRAPNSDWPDLHIRQQVATTADGPAHLGESEARLPISDDEWLLLDRRDRRATYVTPVPLDADRLVHPLLAPAAGLMARWLGREAFHAGAFLAGDGAWALAGANEAGKSTLLAALAATGAPILTDDLLVVESGRAYAGPRCIDLRDPRVLGDALGASLRAVRDDTRRRMDLPDVTPVAALRGWLYLEWGASVELTPCPAAARFQRLAAQRRWATGPMDPHALLDLAALPAWTLRRPTGPRHTSTVLESLRELTSGRRRSLVA